MEEILGYQSGLPEMKTIIKTIQQDVLKSCQLSESLLEDEIEGWKDMYEEMRLKWHESRRYLRAANKGAERNAQVIQLQAHTISKLLARLKHE